MSKKWYLFSVIILCSYILLIISIDPNTKTIIKEKGISYLSMPKELPVAKLKINKINVENDIYDFKSTENTVEKNVMILDGSILPNNDHDSIIFLAAHSGSGRIAYFDDLDQLKPKDQIIFEYKGINYIYYVIKILVEEKDGDIEINKLSTQQLVLTTCSKEKGKQLIVISSLLKKEGI